MGTVYGEAEQCIFSFKNKGAAIRELVDRKQDPGPPQRFPFRLTPFYRLLHVHVTTSVAIRAHNTHVCTYVYMYYNIIYGLSSTYCRALLSEIKSVDSLCRDGADTPMSPYIGKAFTCTNVED